MPDDADEILADFGDDLVCAAVPGVTRGLVDDAVLEEENVGHRTTTQRIVLKVKKGAFGNTKVNGTLITFTDRTPANYSIDEPLPRPSSLFDYYVLQPRRA